MMLTRYGIREWLTTTFLSVALAILFAWLNQWWVVGIVIALWLGVVMFFRDPVRRVPSDLPMGTMLSPADGVITAIERIEHHEATNGPAVVIRIFLSILNVHINRSPYDAEVVSLKHTPGTYMNAQRPESAAVNESNLITMRIETGETIAVRQVAGMIARRIVCPLKPGDRLMRGEKFGMIKFGSTTELILPRPDDVTVQISTGNRVKAGLTTLAILQFVSSTSESERSHVNAADSVTASIS